MSLKKSTKERIKKYILEKIETQDTSLAKKVADSFNVSLTTVYRYINELYKEGLIEKNGKKIKLKEDIDYKIYYTSDKLEEDKIFEEIVAPKIKELQSNVYKIWQYAFTEMMNNAIDHSGASEIAVFVLYNCVSTSVIIEDNGIGIFKKIKDFYGYESLDDAVIELFKGKLTTDVVHHTGEGIFFTSRMIEKFAVLSGGKIFTHNPQYDITRDIQSVPDLKAFDNRKGTMVVMIMPNKSKTNMKDIFNSFSDIDDGFNRTQIPLKSIFTDGFPVSRSQAKRVSARFEDFKDVILDFDGIDDIGQGFAHELFVVFAHQHPDVNLININTNEDVKKMIAHVKRT